MGLGELGAELMPNVGCGVRRAQGEVGRGAYRPGSSWIG